jgi:hypothetical protein
MQDPQIAKNVDWILLVGAGILLVSACRTTNEDVPESWKFYFANEIRNDPDFPRRRMIVLKILGGVAFIVIALCGLFGKTLP